MISPIIDVVIPAHNAASCIAQAIQSALYQKHLGQILVCADHCSDDTATIANAAGAHVVIAENFGSAAKARNAAAFKGQAPWIAFLDADDRYLSGWLKAAAQKITTISDETAMLFGGAFFCSADQKRTQSAPFPADGDVFHALLTRSFFTTSATLIRRDVFQKEHGFNTQVNGAVLEDYELFTRILAKSPAAFIHQPLVEYTLSEKSATRDPKHFFKLRERGLHIVEAALQNRPVPRHIEKKAYAQMHRMSAERFLANHLVNEARSDLKNALKYTPKDPQLWAMAALSTLRDTERDKLLQLRRAVRAARLSRTS